MLTNTSDTCHHFKTLHYFGFRNLSMETYIKNMNKKYDRVMPRISNRSRSSLKSLSTVTRHEIPSSSRIGAKPSVSNIGSSVFSELPVVLNDYVPESSGERSTRRTLVVKPRKTVKSLDPALSPHRSVKVIEPRKRDHNLASQSSAPSVMFHERAKWSDMHVDNCFTSKSHSKLKELKDEIKAYHNSDKLTRLRSHLYKRCGVLLDDVGQVAADKAVQVEDFTEEQELDKGEGDRRFPTDPDKKLRWIEATGRQEWMPTKFSTICSLHFTENDYTTKKSGKRYLKSRATPQQNIVMHFSHSQRLKRKHEEEPIDNESMKTCVDVSTQADLESESYENPESEADIVFKNWALKLNRLAPHQRLFAEKIINDVLFEGEMGTLTRNGVQFLPNIQPVNVVQTIPAPLCVVTAPPMKRDSSDEEFIIHYDSD